MAGSVLSSDLTIDGDIHAGANELLIECQVRGDIFAKKLTVGPQARIGGRISAGAVKIEGAFSGQVECKELSVTETARINADIAVKR